MSGPRFSNQTEIEIKLAVPGAGEADALLRRAGFEVSRPRQFEANAVYDTPDARLRSHGELLRLRQVGAEVILTYKGPSIPGKHKVREELEVRVSDLETAGKIFERLGLDPSFRYEKFRTEYRHAAAGGIATVDETPIGVFIELEGEAAWIDETAARLGFNEDDYVTLSYGRLYLDHCERTGISPSHMVFASQYP